MVEMTSWDYELFVLCQDNDLLIEEIGNVIKISCVGFDDKVKRTGDEIMTLMLDFYYRHEIEEIAVYPEYVEILKEGK